VGTIKKSIIGFIGLFLFSFSVLAQNRANVIKIEVERNKDQEPTFYAINNGYMPYTVSVEFYDVRNSLPPNPNPIVKTVKPGRTQLVRLKKSGLSQGGIGFGYRYSYNVGCLDTEPDDIEYLIPIAEGQQTEIGDLYYIGELINEEEPDGFYSLSFSSTNGADVYAARSGTVVDVVDEYDDSQLDKYFTSEYNYVRVVHDDCTFANYRHLKKGSITVRIGDKITAGEPLAKVVPRGGSEDPKFRLMITYRNESYEKGTDTEYWKYVTPVFRSGNEESVMLKPGQSYIAIHPDDVITQEMGFFERRRWKRRN